MELERVQPSSSWVMQLHGDLGSGHHPWPQQDPPHHEDFAVVSRQWLWDPLEPFPPQPEAQLQTSWDQSCPPPL